MKPRIVDWTSTPEGAHKYAAARVEAQNSADKFGYDYGIERNNVMRTFHVFMLPRRENRRGFELRCEVVSPMRDARPGHGAR